MGKEVEPVQAGGKKTSRKDSKHLTRDWHRNSMMTVETNTAICGHPNLILNGLVV
jgi:hypothetical protein